MNEDKLVGRASEVARLRKYASSGKAEFVAVYGRRRVGKTFLINKVFKDAMAFSMTGIIGGAKQSQIAAFVDGMDRYGGPVSRPSSWHEAFRMLRHHLMSRLSRSKPCVVFIDELPCFDTRKSGFLEALGHFWNSWASMQPKLKLIVCGSATSWMIENLIDSRGGLHNRITHEIHLREFTLLEVEEYLRSRGFVWPRELVLQTYMVMGGVAYYLSLLDEEKSLAQNIDSLCFGSDGEMRREFQRLYKTLYATSEPYVAIVEALFKKKQGLTRGEIATELGVQPNGRLTKMLRDLVDSDIVRFYPTKQKKLSTRNGLFQLMDFFSMFHLRFIKQVSNDPQYWTKNMHTPRINTWRGLAFERVCMAHIGQIKKALGIEGISTTHYSWFATAAQTGSKRGAQIDLVIERADNITNVCEAKYSEMPYTIHKDEYTKLLNRMELFRRHTSCRGGIVPTIITSSGLARNGYTDSLGAKSITANDLFTATQNY